MLEVDDEDRPKQCTPDSIDATTAACCDDQGMFATTSVECSLSSGAKGYCNAGSCSTFTCFINLSLRTGEKVHLDTFCGVSELNTCSAKCASSVTEVCYDPVDTWVESESLFDGAFCTINGMRGTCFSGDCEPLPNQLEGIQAGVTAKNANPDSSDTEDTSDTRSSMKEGSVGATYNVQLLQFLLGIVFACYQAE